MTKPQNMTKFINSFFKIKNQIRHWLREGIEMWKLVFQGLENLWPLKKWRIRNIFFGEVLSRKKKEEEIALQSS